MRIMIIFFGTNQQISVLAIAINHEKKGFLSKQLKIFCILECFDTNILELIFRISHTLTQILTVTHFVNIFLIL